MILPFDNKGALPQEEIRKSNTISILVATENDSGPGYLNLHHLEDLVPNAISYEILLISYNYIGTSGSNLYSNKDLKRNFQEKVVANTSFDKINNNIFHMRTERNFTEAILEGLKSAKGQYVLVVDADFPYPEDLICKLIEEVINSPNTLMIASRYSKSILIHKLSLMRTVLSKSARLIARYGLKVRDVHDPLSRCFAISRNLLKSIKIEGKSDELLLELLVKLNKTGNRNKAIVKEIPFSQKRIDTSKKLDFVRFMGYPKTIWQLYRYGSKSEIVKSNSTLLEQKKHKSVIFLSKAGRFLTVGASGLLVNYAVSLLMTNLIPNMWYIHATLIGILSSISTNFLLNKIWTFEDRDFSTRHIIKQYFLFLAFCSFGAVIQLTLISIFVDYYHIQYAVSLIMAVAVASIGNFLLNKKITFGERIWE